MTQMNWGDLRKFVEQNTQIQDDEPIVIATWDNMFVIDNIKHVPAIQGEPVLSGIWIQGKVL